jgi:hypothetical protein
MAVDALAAHRLTLTAPEWAVLSGVCGVGLPPGFEAARFEGPDLREAARALAARGVVTADLYDPLDCRPVASVVANLAVVAAPVAAVRVEVSVHGRGSRAFHAISGPLGASLFALAAGAVELSMFPAEALGRELLRAVPTADELVTVWARVGAALGGGTGGPVVGRLPLAALDTYAAAGWVAGHDAGAGHDGAAGHDSAAGIGLTAAEAGLAARVAQRTAGTLWGLVTGRGGDGVLVGQVVWLATDQGWIGLRPDPDGSGRRMVVLEPVARDAIGVWLAPLLAEILEVSGDRS